MGMNAELIGIGPYNETIEDLMDYDGQIPEGDKTVATLFYCNTSSQSRSLAEACGLKNPFQNTNVKGDIEFGCIEGVNQKEVEEAMIKYHVLKRSGFEFFYLVNG